MKKYMDSLKWVVAYVIDRSTQDDKKSKFVVAAAFPGYCEACDYKIANTERKTYVLYFDKIEEAEQVYNLFQDLREKYGERAIYHFDELHLNGSTENLYREIFKCWTSIDF